MNKENTIFTMHKDTKATNHLARIPEAIFLKTKKGSCYHWINNKKILSLD